MTPNQIIFRLQPNNINELKSMTWLEYKSNRRLKEEQQKKRREETPLPSISHEHFAVFHFISSKWLNQKQTLHPTLFTFALLLVAGLPNCVCFRYAIRMLWEGCVKRGSENFVDQYMEIYSLFSQKVSKSDE